MIFPEPSAEDTTRSVPRRATLTAGLATGAALLALLVALLGAGIAARGTGELRIPAAGATTVLRVAVFAALALHLGELAGIRLARTGPLPRSWALAAALTGAGAAAGQILLLAAVSGLGLTEVYGTVEGRLLLVMANGFLLAAGCVALNRPPLAVVPLAVVVGAEALRAHPEPYTPLLGAALTVVHLGAAALWTGGLLHALRTMRLRRADPAGAREVLARYARLAGRLFAALVLTGTLSTLRRLPVDVVLTTAYGRVLIAKLLLVGVVAALALAARRRLRRAADATGPARVELAVLALVLLVSAILTVVPDPHWLSTR
ncbi:MULTISPECIES: CopD family protein [unclassified Streptomyces]|uniref:CopD family protein n=1 Tax=unclassified Streptomyces TaxID=2593676 RepID=UPI002E2D73A8|nr:CopD family protein [Streptomyces sp. NBC_01429]